MSYYTEKNPKHKDPKKVQDTRKSHELGWYHSLFRNIYRNSTPTVAHYLTSDDNRPQADSSPSCKQAVSPCFSTSKLGIRETQEQTPINQNENSATTCYCPLLIQTPDLPMHQAKIQGGIREQI